MPQNQASFTALATAYMRAAHQLLEAKPLLFDDPVALPLLGPEASKNIQDTADHYRTPEILALRTRIILRSQFTEDRLAAQSREESGNISSSVRVSIHSH